MPNPSTNPYIPQVWHLEPRAAATRVAQMGHIDSTMSKLLRGSERHQQHLLTIAGESTLRAAAAGGDYPSHLPSDEDLGVTHLNWKTNDGPHWMNRFDARGVSGPDHWMEMMDGFRRRGITLTPWCVPTWTGSHAHEIDITSSIITISNQMVFNVEYWGDQYFWQGGRTGIVPYIGELRRRHPLAHFTIQYDTRNPYSIHIEDWLPYVDHMIDMSYWPDFGQDMGMVLGLSWQRMDRLAGMYGKTFSFTYPGTARSYPTWEVDESPIYIFRRGNMTPACVSLVQSGRPPMTPPVDPPIPPPSFEEERNQLLRDQYERSYRDKVQTDVRFDHDIQALTAAGLPIPEVRL